MTPFMRTSFTAAIVTFTVVATAGTSLARPDARQMTCHQTQSLIERNGAAVLTTGRYTYDRFVAYNGYCWYPEVPHVTYISTRDTDRCPVFHCKEPIWSFDD